jgi:hypothetical protein
MITMKTLNLPFEKSVIIHSYELMIMYLVPCLRGGRPPSIVSIRRPLFAIRRRVVSPSATSLPLHRCHHQIEGLIVVYMG